MNSEYISTIADGDLSPNDLSSKTDFMTWAAIYSAIHLGIVVFTLTVETRPATTEYVWAVRALMVGPAIYLTDMYLRQIWFPYWKEMRRRSGVPPRRFRNNPYDIEMKIIGTAIFMPGLFALIIAMRFVWFEQFSHVRMFSMLLPSIAFGIPACCFGFYHTYFIWKGHR